MQQNFVAGSLLRAAESEVSAEGDCSWRSEGITSRRIENTGFILSQRRKAPRLWQVIEYHHWDINLYGPRERGNEQAVVYSRDLPHVPSCVHPA